MNKNISKSVGAFFGAYSSSPESKKSRSFSPVLDSSKKPIRGLWKRGKIFYARITTTDSNGKRAQRRVPLNAKTLVQAQAELEKIRQKPVVSTGQQYCPTWTKYWPIYISQIHHLKRPSTVDSEKLHCKHWAKFIGDIRLHLIRKSHLLNYRSEKLKAGWTGRTVNLSITVLSNVLNHAQDNGLIEILPTAGIKPIRWKPKKRPLFTFEQIESICTAALENARNGQLLADYLRLMTRCGSRASETLRLKWSDVKWDKQQLIIGSDGLSKNHESRAVDFNTSLADLLTSMQTRGNGSAWLLPAPRMSREDAPAKSLKEAIYRARKIAGVHGFGFHDCRHYFISHAVMSGIDYMTIAKWVGHKDGGVLIGRVYGHLNDEHAKRQARKLRLS